MIDKEDAEQEWELIWKDEFATEGKPNSSKWSFAGRGSADWARYCTDTTATAFVTNGKLHLRGILEATSDTIKYHTGCIETKGKFSFRYGKVKHVPNYPQGRAHGLPSG